jgi:hypothetical protein
MRVDAKVVGERLASVTSLASTSATSEDPSEPGADFVGRGSRS